MPDTASANVYRTLVLRKKPMKRGSLLKATGQCSASKGISEMSANRNSRRRYRLTLRVWRAPSATMKANIGKAMRPRSEINLLMGLLLITSSEKVSMINC